MTWETRTSILAPNGLVLDVSASEPIHWAVTFVGGAVFRVTVACGTLSYTFDLDLTWAIQPPTFYFAARGIRVEVTDLAPGVAEAGAMAAPASFL